MIRTLQRCIHPILLTSPRISPLYSPIPRIITRHCSVVSGNKIANDILQAISQMKKAADTPALPTTPTTLTPPPLNSEIQPANESVQIDAPRKVKNMAINPDTLARILFAMSAQWGIKYLALVVKFITPEWGVDRMADFLVIFFKRYVASTPLPPANSKNDRQVWDVDRFGELVGRSVDNKEEIFITDLVIKFVIGHENNNEILIEDINKLYAQRQQAPTEFFEKLGRIIGKVVAMQHNWLFPITGVALREFTTVIPKYARSKYSWFTQDLYLDYIANVLVSSGVAKQKENSQVVVSKNFMHNALKDVTDFWQSSQIDELLEKVYEKMGDRDSYIKYWLNWLKTQLLPGESGNSSSRKPGAA